MIYIETRSARIIQTPAYFTDNSESLIRFVYIFFPSFYYFSTSFSHSLSIVFSHLFLCRFHFAVYLFQLISCKLESDCMFPKLWISVSVTHRTDASYFCSLKFFLSLNILIHCFVAFSVFCFLLISTLCDANILYYAYNMHASWNTSSCIFSEYTHSEVFCALSGKFKGVAYAGVH